MTVNRVDYPYIEGTRNPSATTTIRVDLRRVQRMEVHGYDAGKAIRKTIGIVVIAFAVLFIAGGIDGGFRPL
jgi:hypothetical protein